MPDASPDGDLMAGRPVLNPTLMNLAYQWPVHRIGLDCRPRKPQPTCLLVFRDDEDAVQFSASNPATSRLLALLQTGHLSGRAACLQLAAEMHHPVPEALIPHGQAILADLRRQGIISGTRHE